MNPIEPISANSPAPIYVIDDDRGIRSSLVTLLSANGLQARPFADPLDLLDDLVGLEPGCFLIDVAMPSMNGIELLAAIREQDCYWPAAIMTAHGEIPLAVRAIKLGAIEFLEKPFTSQALEEVLLAAFAELPKLVAQSKRYKAARELISSLSPRQAQVFEGVISGLSSKEIAQRHGLSHRTVESYRNNMMAKLGVNNMLELFELKFLLDGGAARDNR